MKIRRIIGVCMAAVMTCSALAMTVSASSHKNYTLETTEVAKGAHKYMDNKNKTYKIRYACTMSGCVSKNDAATIKCFKDEWTYATRKPDDQTKFGNGSWTPWWGSCEDGDYNLELHAGASGRKLKTVGTFENY